MVASPPDSILSPETAIAALADSDNQIRYYAACSLGHIQAANAIIEAKVANSLKLLNLKRILEAALDIDNPDEAAKREKSQALMGVIDDLLIKL